MPQSSCPRLFLLASSYFLVSFLSARTQSNDGSRGASATKSAFARGRLEIPVGAFNADLFALRGRGIRHRHWTENADAHMRGRATRFAMTSIHAQSFRLGHPFFPRSSPRFFEGAHVWSLSIRRTSLMGTKDQKDIGSVVYFEWPQQPLGPRRLRAYIFVPVNGPVSN